VSDRFSRAWTNLAMAVVLVSSIGLVKTMEPVSASSGATPVVLYVGHGVEVVEGTVEGHPCSAVLLSTDGVHWRDVTPPLANKPPTCLYVWATAAFVSPLVGWVSARNGGSNQMVLEHTVDGGKIWARQADGITGSNGGMQTVSFANANLGWRQTYGWGGNYFAVQVTTDGGRSWPSAIPFSSATGGCGYDPVVYVTPKIGFASGPLQASTTGDNAPVAWRTTDGGRHWSHFALRSPAWVRGATPLYGAPSFWGMAGVWPVDYVTAPSSAAVDGEQVVVLYSTSDAGATWTSSEYPSVAWAGGPRLNARMLSSGCYIGDSIGSGLLAVTSAPRSTAVWVLRPPNAGPWGIHRLTGRLHAESLHLVTSLPASVQFANLQALDTQRALLSIQSRGGSRTVYETVNGGRNWHQIHQFARTASGAYNLVTLTTSNPTVVALHFTKESR